MGNDYRRLNALMRHIRTTSGMNIAGSQHKRALARIGYFHGYKGYRYAHDPKSLIPYSSFDELLAVIEFDAEVRSLLYPMLSSVELALKNLSLEPIMSVVGSSDLSDLHARLLSDTGIRGSSKASALRVIRSNTDVLVNAYVGQNRIIQHYYDSSRGSIPIWALFEVLPMGKFGSLLEQFSLSAKLRIADSWGMTAGSAEIIHVYVLAVSGLRNAVAHNDVVFDARFNSRKHKVQFMKEVASYFGLRSDLNFSSITDYIMLVTLLHERLDLGTRKSRCFVRDYEALAEQLYEKLPTNIAQRILRTDSRTKIRAMKDDHRNI